MHIKKTFISSFIIYSLLSGLLIYPVSAGGESCNFKEQFDALAEIQKNSLENYSLQLRNELILRKEILEGVVNCAQNDIKNLKGNLSSIKTENTEIKEIRDRFLQSTDEITAHYEQEKSRIPDLGLYGTKEFSRNLKNWREANETPLIQKATNFYIWTNNQGLFETTGDRLQQISRTVSALKLGDNEDIKALFSKAGNSFHNAERINRDIKELFKKNVSEEETLTAIQSSLTSLAETYQTFFELSEAVHTFIPRP